MNLQSPVDQQSITVNVDPYGVLKGVASQCASQLYHFGAARATKLHGLPADQDQAIVGAHQDAAAGIAGDLSKRPVSSYR